MKEAELIVDEGTTSDKHYEYDVALSYAGEDRAPAATLANILKSRGAKVFYDQYEKPILWGKDLYIHLFETDGDAGAAVDNIRDHPLFREISKKLEPYVSPYNPKTWRSPKDATARLFYQYDAEIPSS